MVASSNHPLSNDTAEINGSDQSPAPPFSQEQVLAEVRAIEAGTLDPDNSPVYDAWMDMAGDWLADDPSEYLQHGFDGFYDRKPETILCDFHFGGKLTVPLTDEQIDKFHGIE